MKKKSSEPWIRKLALFKFCKLNLVKVLFSGKKIDILGITLYTTGQDILASQRNSNMNEEWNFPFVFHNN